MCLMSATDHGSTMCGVLRLVVCLKGGREHLLVFVAHARSATPILQASSGSSCDTYTTKIGV